VPKGHWLGIDFSGNHLKWRPRCTTSNVWIADVFAEKEDVQLRDVRRVQQLPGAGDPFDRLVALLASADYDAAGIDAPFSVPDTFVGRVGGYAALLSVVASQTSGRRPFINGFDMARIVAGTSPPLTPPKPMRATDTFWAKRGVNVRSPMWTGARPGAPMTAACLTLLQRSGRPTWPWSSRAGGLLVEAFPAAQLNIWGLPHAKYDGRSSSATAVRSTIIDALAKRMRLGSFRPTLLASADALDAVVCAFAAMAVSGPKVSIPNCPTVATEGWVAVHP